MNYAPYSVKKYVYSNGSTFSPVYKNTGGGQMLGALLGGLAAGALGLLGTAMTNQANKEATQEAWQRDDTSMQRRVADYEAAGLSKWAAAGSSGSVSAPYSVESPDFSTFGDAFQHMAGNALTEAQTKAQKYDTWLQTQTATAQMQKARAEAEGAATEAAMAAHDLKIYRERGVASNDSSLQKNIGSLISTLTGGSKFGSQLEEIGDKVKNSMGIDTEYVPQPKSDAQVLEFNLRAAAKKAEEKRLKAEQKAKEKEAKRQAKAAKKQAKSVSNNTKPNQHRQNEMNHRR